MDDDDDDFGDLYTDIVLPVVSPPSGPLTAGDRTPLGNPNSQTLIETPNDEWLPDNWNDDAAAAASAGVPLAGAFAFHEEEEVVQEARTPEPEGFRVPEFEIGSVDLDQDPVIPGLSSAPVPPASIELRASNSEDWDSDDSEDDLQIVLNDSSHHNHHQMMVMGEDEEGQEEDVAMEEQDWGDGELPLPAAAVGGERKEGTEAAAAAAVKTNGAAGALAGGVAARVGYGTHTFHPQHHSMYKYVRPGAAPGPPVFVAVGPPGQVRPPTLLGPNAGRGRGDWRPPGIRGSFHYGYPVPAWGSSLGRGFGGGLDFTLPSHKTVFEVDLESFEEKPWRHPGVDISDYFNFGLNEDSWKDYRKQLDQLRLESTMQSKIRVHEFVRPEQDYDPDLPPELAAATGRHDISADNLHYGKIENGQVDLNGQGRGAPMRPLLPQGRPIQVETAFGERLPSIDTRPPRTRDADAIIEIVLHDSMDDSAIYDGALDQAEKGIQGEQLKGIQDVEGARRGESEFSDNFPPSINGWKRERVNRRMPFAPEGDGILSFPPTSPLYYHPNARLQTPLNPSGSVGTHHGGRLGQGASRGRCSSTSGDNSNDAVGNRNAQVKKHDIHQQQRPGDSMEGKQTPELSPDLPVETSRELSTEQKDDFHDDRVDLGDTVYVGGEETSDSHISGKIVGDDRIDHSSAKQKLSSRVEQHVTQDNGDHEDLRGTQCDNRKAKSGSSKEYKKQRDNGEEVVQDRQLKRARDLRRHQEDEHMTRGKDDFGREGRHEIDRNRMSSKGSGPMHNSYPYRHWDSNSAHPVRGRSEGFERPREPDILFRQRREDDINRRVKDEDLRRERNDETGLSNRNKFRVSDRNDKDDDIHTKKGVDDRDWRGRHREEGPRQREKDDALTSRRENFDELLAKRNKDEDHLRRERVDREDSLHVYKAREDSGRQKRERDNIADNGRGETSRIRGKPDDHHTSKHRDESWRHREREDSQRLRLPHEESLVHREREEGRGATRRRQPIEDKPLGGSGRSKNDSQGIVSDKDYLHRDKRRHVEQSKKGYHTGEENNLLHKGHVDVRAREKHYNREEKSSRHERLSTHDDHSTSASDNHHMTREKLRDGTRKSKDIEGSGYTSQGLSKREHEDYNIQQNEKVKSRGTREQDSNIPSVSKKGNQLAHSSVRHGEDIASDDENQQESRKGRSKMERWTSHKERDFSASSMQPSLSSTAEEVEGTDIDVGPTDELPKIEGNDASDPDAKGADEGEITDKVGDDRDRHLDTVAKLMKRSERFKLPMPGEKDMAVSKKREHESQLAQTEGVVGAEVKPERPARKRRWTSS